MVDPLDGTREFVQGIPEFCVSIGFVEDGRPVAGGICNPATNETIIGAIDTGVLYNGKPARSSQRTTLKGSLILASRSEVKRGEWQQFLSSEYQIRPMGSVAVQTCAGFGRTRGCHFTLTPKNEWESRGGGAGGKFRGIREHAGEYSPQCNRKKPLLSGLLASGPFLREELWLRWP